MNKKLSLFIYPKNNRTACLTLKNGRELYRINHLWEFREFAASLEAFVAMPGMGNFGQEQLDLNDKKGKKWALVFCFANMDCRLSIWKYEVDHARVPEFNWDGTLDLFTRAVNDLLKMLR